jgi:hypothetical protein
MATSKQVSYLKSLMIDAGLVHPQGYLRGDAKYLPHHPTMSERQKGFGAWAGRLTVRQTSEVIDYLLELLGERKRLKEQMEEQTETES